MQVRTTKTGRGDTLGIHTVLLGEIEAHLRSKSRVDINRFQVVSHTQREVLFWGGGGRRRGVVGWARAEGKSLS